MDHYKPTLSLKKQAALIVLKDQIVTSLSNLLIEEFKAFNVHQSELSQPRTATGRAKARRTAHVVSASLETTGTQRCTQGPTLVPLVALSTGDSSKSDGSRISQTSASKNSYKPINMSHPPHGPSSDIKRTFSSDVEDHPSPPASDPESRHSASPANNPRLPWLLRREEDPDANKPSSADAPGTHREATRQRLLIEMAAGAATGATGGAIVGGGAGAALGLELERCVQRLVLL